MVALKGNINISKVLHKLFLIFKVKLGCCEWDMILIKDKTRNEIEA